MPKYPMWVQIEYMELEKKIGYTGCLNSKVDLIDVFIRLEIYQTDIVFFKINNTIQSQEVLDQLFEEVEKTRKEGEEANETRKKS